MTDKYKKIALSVSLLLVVVWCVFGTGASLAWFVDTGAEIKNVFHFAEFDLVVEHRLDNGKWDPVEQDTTIFDEKALYEPGYVQIVYLRVKNNGTVPFNFKTAVSVTDYNEPTNIFGQTFHLQDHLKFGLFTADSEAELYEAVATRDLAKELAVMPLSNYATDTASLDAGGTVYLALIVRMPEEVGNIANYRGNDIPWVELGVIISATQQKE